MCDNRGVEKKDPEMVKVRINRTAQEQGDAVRDKLGREPTILEAFGWVPGVGPVVETEERTSPYTASDFFLSIPAEDDN